MTLDEEIQKTYAEVKKKEKFVQRIGLLSQQILQQELLLAELDAQKNKELKDVEALQSDSLRNIFQFFLGKKEDLLEIERQEYLWAELNYLACKRRIKALKIEKATLETKHNQFAESDKYLNDLLIRKQRRINKSVKVFATYKSLSDRVLQNAQLLKEIEEAQQIGSILIEKISDLKIELVKIKHDDNWFSIDYKTKRKFHGKGNNSSFEKKQFGKISQEIIFEIDKYILKFKSELEDLHTNYELDYTRHLVILEKFLSIFYDNLITDWVVQREILNAQKSTDILFGRVERILLMLDHVKKTTFNTLEYYRLKRREFLLDE